jgi:hypothetical protein
MHILTVPIENRFDPTVRWAELDKNGNVNFLHQPEYHGNPVDKNGSPVFWHYGYDIAERITKNVGVVPYIQT